MSCSPGARCQACRDLTDRDVAEMMRQDREAEDMTRRTAQDWESFVVGRAAEMLKQVKAREP